MVKYGLFEVAQEQIEIGKSGYSKFLTRMLFEHTPPVQRGSSMI
jgi:hypothetical protein